MPRWIKWRCSSCGVQENGNPLLFDTQTDYLAHREAEHPERVAAQVAFEAAIAGGASEEEAELVYDRAYADAMAGMRPINYDLLIADTEEAMAAAIFDQVLA